MLPGLGATTLKPLRGGVKGTPSPLWRAGPSSEQATASFLLPYSSCGRGVEGHVLSIWCPFFQNIKAWMKEKSEVEIVDLVLKLREKLVS